MRGVLCIVCMTLFPESMISEGTGCPECDEREEWRDRHREAYAEGE